MKSILFLVLVIGGSAEKATPRFESFAVAIQRVKPVAPVLDSREARRFRTVLRRGAAQGPNFAGHFTVVEWGCGTCCNSFAIVNAKTGKVWFPNYVVMCYSPMNTPVRGQATVLFRADNRLFIVIAALTETKPGTYYYEWDGDELKLLKVVKDY